MRPHYPFASDHGFEEEVKLESIGVVVAGAAAGAVVGAATGGAPGAAAGAVAGGLVGALAMNRMRSITLVIDPHGRISLRFELK